MSVRVIKVPDVGEGIAEVELVAWHVAPGDEVAEDQPVPEREGFLAFDPARTRLYADGWAW